MRSVYIIYAPFRHPLKHKIGIAKNAGNRAKQVDKTVAGPVFPLWVVPAFHGKATEAAVHRIFGFLRSPIGKKGGKTNGETEWFYTLNFITAGFFFIVPVSYWGFAVGFLPEAVEAILKPLPKYWALFLLPIPFDSILVLTVVAAWGWLWRGAALSISVYIIYNHFNTL